MSAQTPAPTPLVPAVRAAATAGQWQTAERLLADARTAGGLTPTWLEAQSWLGRGALAGHDLTKADAYAAETLRMADAMLKGRTLDAEPHLPIALGAGLEVRAQVRAAQGARSEAVADLQRALRTYAGTSITKRIQKNINLISLEGTPAPVLDGTERLAAAGALAPFAGRVTVLFFWAHWCPDCKAQAAALAMLLVQHAAQGLQVIAPTQRYGYVDGGRDASPAAERDYIERVRLQYYGFVPGSAVPLAEANHQRYGVSTTPTLVIVDRAGIVRRYHPGNMTLAELEAAVTPLLAVAAGQ